MKAEITQFPNLTTNGFVKTSGGNGAASVATQVVTADIADANITEAKIATNAISTTKIVDGAVANTKIQDSTIAITKLATNTLTRMARAWVNFNGAPQTGTYNLPNLSSTLTVTIASHGLTVGQIVNLDFTSGTMPDGHFTILTVTTNTFTVNAGFTENGGGRSGNVTKLLNIRAASGISTITDNGVGDFTLNFTSPMNSANFVVGGGAGRGGAGTSATFLVPQYGTGPTTSAVRIGTINNAGAAVDCEFTNVIIFGD